MPRLVIEQRKAVDTGYDQLARIAAQRITAMPAEQCPLEFTLSLTRLYVSESCGKCTPCRVGLMQIAALLQSLLDGEGDENTVETIRVLAQNALDTADCAIGFEAGRSILKSLEVFAQDYASHAQNDSCTYQHNNYLPCQQTCPAHVDIPGYIACINAGRYEDALRVIRNDNPLPTVCGYVCEHPCEFTCRRTLVDSALNICGLKRYAADNAKPYSPAQNHPETGKNIAVIGGGPAGLSAAYYLQLMGHQVTIFDMRAKLGGMVRYGIPDYRLPQEKLDEDIDFILSTGVQTKMNTTVGIDITYDEIARNYDAVYLSIGAHSDKKLRIDGEDAQGVISAVAFLRAAGDGMPIDLSGKRVVVVGGGNVAMDCTRTARRLGAASVECVYRRRIADMTALAEEIEEAMAEGCQITELQAPVRVECGEDGSVSALVVQPQKIGPVGKDGRPKPVDAQAPERTIECDVILVAIGQAIDTKAFEHAIPTEWGKITAQPDGSIALIPAEGNNTNDGALIFAGGDAVSGPATVIRAVAAGKVAAANIDSALGFKHNVFDEVEIPAATQVLPATGRVELCNRNFSEAIQSFDIAKDGMSDEEAQQESSRCLRCDCHGFGAVSGRKCLKW